MGKTAELSMLRTRVAQVTTDLHQLAYMQVDPDLQIVQLSPRFPPGLAEIELESLPARLEDAFGEFVGMDKTLSGVLEAEYPSFEIERVNRVQPDGSVRYLTFRVVPLEADRPVDGLLVIVEDVTNFGLVEHSLVQSRNELHLIRDALARTNTELDQRVEQRTAELAAAAHQIKKQLHRLEALRLNDLAILGTTDLRLALKTIAERSRKHLGVDVAAFFLFDPFFLRFDSAVVVGARGTELQNAAVRLGDTLIGRAALERRMILIPDLEESPQPDMIGRPEGFIFCAAIPLIAKGNLVGVMYLGKRSHLRPDQEWLDFLDALAGQAAMAIENLKAFQEMQRSNLELGLAYGRTIESWSRALDMRDRVNLEHTRQVAEMTLRMAGLAGISQSELMHVQYGALLHDVGEMVVPDSILLKKAPLSDEEWAVIRSHPIYAYEMLSPIEFLRPTLEIPYCHHEKWDGSGYPRGLAGEKIPLTARLFAVVDVWDSMISERPYRKRHSEAQALEYIRSQSGGHFDPYAIELFFRALNEYRRQSGSRSDEGTQPLRV